MPRLADCIAIFLGLEGARHDSAWLIVQILKNYAHLALINTGQYGLERYRDCSQRVAGRLGLRYEEIPVPIP